MEPSVAHLPEQADGRHVERGAERRPRRHGAAPVAVVVLGAIARAGEGHVGEDRIGRGEAALEGEGVGEGLERRAG